MKDSCLKKRKTVQDVQQVVVRSGVHRENEHEADKNTDNEDLFIDAVLA